MIYKGGCHCGAVKFEIDIEENAETSIEIENCNCSICEMTGFLHLIVPKSKFRLLSGSEELTVYSFNTGVAKHTFCKICGIKSFYIPRSNPDGFSVNLRCLSVKPKYVKISDFDGQNWEAHGYNLASKSKP